MKVLGIESAGMVGGVALVEDETVIAESIFDTGMVHGREIAPTVERICRENGIKLGELGLIAVDVGPGSYTGLRVGLAAAKALAFALQCPILGVPSLDAIAEAAAPKAPADTTLAAVLDARWEQVYGALYKLGNPPERVSDLIAESPDAFVRRVPTGSFVCGDALNKYGDRFQAAGIRAAGPEHFHPRPSVIARIAGRRFGMGEKDSFETLVPLYLRKTAAEVNLSQEKSTARKGRRPTKGEEGTTGPGRDIPS